MRLGPWLRTVFDVQLYDHWLGLGLAEAIPASVAEFSALDAAGTPLAAGHLLLLTIDGVHDQIGPGALEAVVSVHAAEPQALADALVHAAADGTGYRDDATAVALTMTTR